MEMDLDVDRTAGGGGPGSRRTASQGMVLPSVSAAATRSTPQDSRQAVDGLDPVFVLAEEVLDPHPDLGLPLLGQPDAPAAAVSR